MGEGRAALALGLAGDKPSRGLLRRLSITRTPAAPLAQHALMLLDDVEAASELVPTLSQVADDHVLELFSRVSSPAAIPSLLRSVSSEAGHRALVHQARVDFGEDRKAWDDWYRDYRSRAGHPRSALHRSDPSSELLWKGALQQLTPASLSNQMRLHALFPSSDRGHGSHLLRRGKLIRTSGTTDQRVLEWNLQTGEPVQLLPDELPEEAQFLWNSPRQLLLCQNDNCRWVYLRGRKIWSSLIPGAVNDPEPWLYRDFVPAPHVSGQPPECFQEPGAEPEWTDDEQHLILHRQSEKSLLLTVDRQGHVVSRSSLPRGTSSHVLQCFSADLSGALVAGRWLDLKRNESLGRRDEFAPYGSDLSPDGSTVAIPSPLCLVARDGSEKVRATLSAIVTRFDPGGRRLAVHANREILVLDATSLAVLQRAPGFDSFRGELCWSESGRFLAVTTTEETRVFDTIPDVQSAVDAPDARLLSEVWSGSRLRAGLAVPLTPEEHRERSNRLQKQLAQPRRQDPVTGLSVLALILCIGTWRSLRIRADGGKTSRLT